MKKIFLILMANLSLLSCSQEKKSTNYKQEKPMYNINQYIYPEAKDVTEANFVEKINKQIKHYDKEPVYYFRIQKQNSLIRVYVNDVNIYDDYELSNTITPIEITNILKSGPQTVKIKMYPVGDLINQDLGLENQPPATKLSDKAKVDLSVVMMDNKSDKGFDDEKVIVEKVSPNDVAGKEYYEFSFTFNAEVPYTFEGWTKGQDLRKLDQELVRKKAEEFYTICGQIFENKNLDDWLKLKYPFTNRIMSSSYVDDQYLEELLNEYKSDVKDYEYTMKPVKGYKLEYMGQGKLIRLITDNQRPKLRGGGALLLGYGKSSTYQPGITLYLPEGRDLATQGFMMWK